jgi:hypothetical protein
LKQNAGPIALKRIGTRRAAMCEVDEDLEALLNDRVTLASFDMRDEPEAACVVLVHGVIEPLPRRRPRRFVLRWRLLGHAEPLVHYIQARKMLVRIATPLSTKSDGETN